MNDRKLKRLFDAAGSQPPPSPPAGFDERVMRAVRCEPALPQAKTPSLFDELNALFPRLAWTAAVVIALCVAADWVVSAMNGPSLTDGVAQISNQWLLNANVF